MAKQTINIGSNANDGTGDPLRTAFDKINDNFTELYGSDNDLNTLDANLDVNNFIITTGVTNGNITITPNGTGDLLLGALRVNGTSISADNSTFINLNEGVIIDGSLRVDDAVNLNTSLTLAAVGSNIATSDTSNANAPSIGQVAESIKRWGGDAITADAGSTGNTVAGARYVETIAPTSGQGSNGDLWFVREA